MRLSIRCICGSLLLLCLVAAVRADSAIGSPSARTDMICPTNNEVDCYPRIFQPTEKFQIIKEGQDLPPGLHVRMNVYEGIREARLNIPEMEDAALKGIPIEQAMVIVENEDAKEPDIIEPPQKAIPSEQSIMLVESEEFNEAESIKPRKAMRDQVPQKPPVPEMAGKIRPPPGGDMGTVQRALLAISMDAPVFDTALDDLSDLSHDIYYGLEIAKNVPVLEKLICLTLGSGPTKFPATEQKRDQKAASILASAIQNNPTALKKVAELGQAVMFPKCEGQNNFVDVLHSRLDGEDPASLKPKIKAISGLIKSPAIREQFLETKGMELLLQIWLKEGEQWDGSREKVAQLIKNNFLDADAGAELGIWPKEPIAQKTTCETDGTKSDDGCWEHHVEAFSKASPDNKAWAEELLQGLQEQRGAKADVKHTEL